MANLGSGIENRINLRKENMDWQHNIFQFWMTNLIKCEMWTKTGANVLSYCTKRNLFIEMCFSLHILSTYLHYYKNRMTQGKFICRGLDVIRVNFLQYWQNAIVINDWNKLPSECVNAKCWPIKNRAWGRHKHKWLKWMNWWTTFYVKDDTSLVVLLDLDSEAVLIAE